LKPAQLIERTKLYNLGLLKGKKNINGEGDERERESGEREDPFNVPI
jgi:hypothetical protein